MRLKHIHSIQSKMAYHQSLSKLNFSSPASPGLQISIYHSFIYLSCINLSITYHGTGREKKNSWEQLPSQKPTIRMQPRNLRCSDTQRQQIPRIDTSRYPYCSQVYWGWRGDSKMQEKWVE